MPGGVAEDDESLATLRELLCKAPCTTSRRKPFDLPSALSLRIAQEMWSTTDVTISTAVRSGCLRFRHVFA